MGQNATTRNWTAGFSPFFHLPGVHLGHIFFTHSHVVSVSVKPKVMSAMMFRQDPRQRPVQASLVEGLNCEALVELAQALARSPHIQARDIGCVCVCVCA